MTWRCAVGPLCRRPSSESEPPTPPPTPCSLCRVSRCRLVINGGEYSAEGAGPPGPRGEKRARQNAALAVLQQCGYAVSFDAPPGPAPGAFGGGPGGGAMGGGQPRYGGKSLDSRHARQAVAQQAAVSRDHYLASLNDELG